MAQPLLVLISKMLANPTDTLKILYEHDCDGDEEAHDDELIEEVYDDYSSRCDRAIAIISKRHGKPMRTGGEDDDAIPANGVFRFGLWSIEGRGVFVAATHEDRELPVLLIAGTTL